MHDVHLLEGQNGFAMLLYISLDLLQYNLLLRFGGRDHSNVLSAHHALRNPKSGA